MYACVKQWGLDSRWIFILSRLHAPGTIQKETEICPDRHIPYTVLTGSHPIHIPGGVQKNVDIALRDVV